MKAGTKFALGAVLIVGSVGYLMASGIKQTGQYFLTPSELAQHVSADPSFYGLGLKVGARVVPGTVSKETATQTLLEDREIKLGGLVNVRHTHGNAEQRGVGGDMAMIGRRGSLIVERERR